MNNNNSKLWLETAEFPKIFKKDFLEKDFFNKIRDEIKKNNILYICTLARGSSNNASVFAKYLIENYMGILVSSLAPSVFSIYKSKLKFTNVLLITISQSGQSPDLLAALKQANENNALTLSFINELNSPIAINSKFLIPLRVGEEISVAASKSFLASVFRLIQFVSCMSKNSDLEKSINDFCSYFVNLKPENKFLCHLKYFKNISQAYVIGRGYAHSIALEAALKLKETCGIHAEAYSGAEVLHGPIELVHKNFCVFIFLQNDETLETMLNLLFSLKEKSDYIFVILNTDLENKILERVYDGVGIPSNFYLIKIMENSIHPVCDLLLYMWYFYFFVADLSILRGFNPDKPKNLRKVTLTN
jgi:glucosamine--fructose-6-phosphate aminotransferase (isomerizing)